MLLGDRSRKPVFANGGISPQERQRRTSLSIAMRKQATMGSSFLLLASKHTRIVESSGAYSCLIGANYTFSRVGLHCWKNTGVARHNNSGRLH